MRSSAAGVAGTGAGTSGARQLPDKPLGFSRASSGLAGERRPFSGSGQGLDAIHPLPVAYRRPRMRRFKRHPPWPALTRCPRLTQENGQFHTKRCREAQPNRSSVGVPSPGGHSERAGRIAQGNPERTRTAKIAHAPSNRPVSWPARCKDYPLESLQRNIPIKVSSPCRMAPRGCGGPRGHPPPGGRGEAGIKMRNGCVASGRAKSDGWTSYSVVLRAPRLNPPSASTVRPLRGDFNVRAGRPGELRALCADFVGHPTPSGGLSPRATA